MSEGEGACAMESLTCGAPHGTAFARCVEEAVGGLMLVSARPVPFTRILRLDFSSEPMQSPAAAAAGAATLAEQDIVDDGGTHTHTQQHTAHTQHTHSTHTHTHTHTQTHSGFRIRGARQCRGQRYCF